MDINTPAISRLLDTWLDEDLGRGDLSNVALSQTFGSAYWIAKQEGIFCGGRLVERLFKRLDQSVQIKILINDGDTFKSDQRLLELKGPTKTLVAGERTSLNLAMHLSGIATKTAVMVKELQGTGIKLADTRKTTPGLRLFEKYAVRCGGGINHRLGLDDTAMLKENHLAWSNSIESALLAVRKSAPWPTRIIVEAENADQAQQAILAGADGVLLDEISPDILQTLVPRLRNLAKMREKNLGSDRIIIEASGVDPANLSTYASTGVDMVSSSASITKSTWIDISMRFAS